MPSGSPQSWPTDVKIIEEATNCSTVVELARRLDKNRSTLDQHLRERGIRPQVRAALQADPWKVRGLEDSAEAAALYAHIQELLKGKRKFSLEDLADECDQAPRRIRAALDTLRERGFRIPREDETGGVITLDRVTPEKVNLHKSLLEGTDIKLGIISDTHLCSKEHAPAELELAYDTFEAEGITEVLHAGDLVAGMGIYRTQAQDVTHHTFGAQVEHAAETYPQREGITTRLIGGNHDLEGDFGKMGANPVVAVCNMREDMEYLGDYDAYVQLPNGAYIELVHLRGGASYAMSYKLQRWVEGIPAGRKPAVVIAGHLHIRGTFEHRGIELMYPGCFEWRTSLLKRLGLQPRVGFHILSLTLGPDGSLVGSLPRWYGFWEGRQAELARAA